MLLFTMPTTRAKTLAAFALAPVLVVSLLFLMGFGRANTSVLGIPVGRQTPPIPAANWDDALRHEIAEHNLSNHQIVYRTDELGYTMRPRQSYYRATLQGTRDGEPVTVDVELLSPDKGEWRLSKWSER